MAEIENNKNSQPVPTTKFETVTSCFKLSDASQRIVTLFL